jgi:hypothetical protein
MPSNRGLRRLLGVLTVTAIVSVTFAWRQATRAQGRGLDHARALFNASSPHDLRAAAEALAVARRPGDCLASAEALALAQLFAEFGEDREAASAAVAAARSSARPAATCGSPRVWSRSARGDPDVANAALADARRFGSPITLARSTTAGSPACWPSGQVTSAALDLARVDARALCAEEPRTSPITACSRCSSCGRATATRPWRPCPGCAPAARTHLGLAADEALFNAALRREFSGVADLADQLLNRGLGAARPRPTRCWPAGSCMCTRASRRPRWPGSTPRGRCCRGGTGPARAGDGPVPRGR